MADLKHVTYCGLHCALCGQGGRIPAQAQALAASLRVEGWEQWGGEMEGFQGFWAFLNDLAASAARCSCREHRCGPPFCSIRKCAQGKGIDVCPTCAVYPCGHILALAKGYPTLLVDGRRLVEIGLDAWIAEQKARQAAGFCYADIRCYPFEVPGD